MSKNEKLLTINNRTIKNKKINIVRHDRHDRVTSRSKKRTTRHSLAQKLKVIQQLDIKRLYIATLLGAIWSGYVVPSVYGNVELYFPGKGDLKQLCTKVLMTCSVLSTVGNYGTMFVRRLISDLISYQFHTKSKSIKFEWTAKPLQSWELLVATFRGCFKRCNADIGEVILDDLKIWPLYDLCCYSLIPPQWRPITTSLMSSGWAMYMSIVSAKATTQTTKATETKTAIETTNINTER